MDNDDSKNDEPAAAQWTEFSDHAIVNWKRVRSAIEHENMLVNHRLTWLFASQAFLFTAFTLAFNAWSNPTTANREQFPFVLGIIEFVGFGTALLIWRGLFAAEKQLNRLDRWWHSSNRDDLEELEIPYDSNDPQRIGAMKRLLPNHPPIEGASSGGIDMLLRQSSIPIVFMIAWAALAVVGFNLVVTALTSIRTLTEKTWPYITIAILTLVMREVWAYARRHKRIAEQNVGPKPPSAES
jgi:hypothetical protein